MNNLLNTNNSKATFGVNLPSGLPELMADMTREVLRDQPENFYEYIANYLEDMLRTRDHLQINQQNVDTLIDLSMTIADLLRETTDMSYHDIEKCTFSISTAIHRYRKNYGIKDIQKHHKFYEDSILKELLEKFNFNAETISYVQKIVEICFNDYFRRQQQKILDPNQLTNVPQKIKRTLEFYRNHLPERELFERAAIIIQSRYRGFRTRKHKQFETEAAIKIQSLYRGHRTRLNLTIKKPSNILNNN